MVRFSTGSLVTKQSWADTGKAEIKYPWHGHIVSIDRCHPSDPPTPWPSIRIDW
ncbi:hypothetical protein C8Q76DRAFT_741934 [Earliella scabrosa]|nr:hypothetical protein C8Q76DRAFT_741934 [Earliella scabrosa]